MFCFYCLKDNSLFEDTTTGDLVCIRCGSCDAHHVTFGEDLPTRPELNPSFVEKEAEPKEKKTQRGRPKTNKTNNTQEPVVNDDHFMTSLKELSRYVCIDRRDICRLHKKTLELVQKDPTLRFVLPAAVVLSVYYEANKPGEAKRSRRTEANKPGEARLEDLCHALKLKVCTVNRILKRK